MTLKNFRWLYISITCLYVAAIFFLAAEAFPQSRATRVNLYVYTEPGEFSLSVEQYRETLSHALIKLDELGAYVKVKRITHSPTPNVVSFQRIRHPGYIYSSNTEAIGQMLRTQARRKKRFKRPEFDVALLPQSIEPDHTRWISGVASEICADTSRGYSGVAIARMGYENHRGQNRKPHAVITTAHEIGHLFGAGHIYQPERNLMNTNISAYIGDGTDDWRTVTVLDESKQQVAACRARLLLSWKLFKAGKKK